MESLVITTHEKYHLIERLCGFPFCIFLKESAKSYVERVFAEDWEPTNGRLSAVR